MAKKIPASFAASGSKPSNISNKVSWSWITPQNLLSTHLKKEMQEVYLCVVLN